MNVLQKGSKGAAVADWQNFLIGQGFLVGLADGDFGKKTVAATKTFQKKNKLGVDGRVGNRTFAAAMQLGLGLVQDTTARGKQGDNWPSPPRFPPLKGNAARQEVFGKFKFKHAPKKNNREHIEILDDWARKNIVTVTVPQLQKAGLKRSGRVRVHRLIEAQFVGLWQAWEDAELLDRVVSFHGTFVPRLVRGGKTLSNHSFGSAFDINLKANRLGHVPALVGEPGSVRELVPLANKFGFYWGGHFRRRDGMHFEAAKLL